MTETAAQRYRREAEECRLNAERAKNPVEREAWLQLAEDWMKLARGEDLNCIWQSMRERGASLTRH
jgi:hypothetical protein